MFCKNCGTQIPDGSAVCSSCGASTAPAATKFDINELVKKITGHKYFIPAVAGVAAVLVIILAASALGGGGMTKPVNNFFNGMMDADIDKFMSAFPEEVQEYFDDYYNDLEEYLEDNFDDFIDDLEDEFGKNVKIKIKVADKKELNKSKTSDLKEVLKNRYDIAKKDVTEAWELECEITISGKDDSDTEDLDVVVFKYDGKWYLDPSLFYFY